MTHRNARLNIGLLRAALIAVILLLCLGAAGAETILGREIVWFNETTFPDAAFRTCFSSSLINNSYVDEQGVTHSTEPFIYVDSFDRMDCYNKGITSLQGIEKLSDLESLLCYDNNLTELNVAGLSKLKILVCYSNKLTELDVSNLTNLVTLVCYGNQITELDVSKLTNLKMLWCYSNRISELDVSKLTNLKDLYCSYNQITELDVSKLTNLKYLYCGNNQITELDVSKLTNLSSLDCFENKLTKLSLNDALASTTCSLSLSSQRPSDVLNGVKIDNSTYQYCLVGYGGLTLEDMGRVTLKSSGSFDATTGIATSPYSETRIEYYYDVYPGSETKNMEVTVNTTTSKLDTINGRKVAWLDAATFPDAAFRTWLGNNFTVNTSYVDSQNVTHNTDSFIYVDDVEAISCISQGIASVQGIEKFCDIESLDCSGNQLTQLDMPSLTNLEYLNCTGNVTLESLDVSRLSDLHTLICISANLTSLEIANLPYLEKIDCSSNYLGTLTLTNLASLSQLYCNDNELTALNVAGLTSLTELQCSQNALTSLDVSALTNLTKLKCNLNQITTLNVSGLANLVELNVGQNNITKLSLDEAVTPSTLYLGGQTAPDDFNGLMIDNNTYQYRLLGYGGLTLEDMGRVRVGGGASSFDAATGIATFTSAQTEIYYDYDVCPGSETSYMDVTINVSWTKPNTINGQRVAWLDEMTFPDAAFRAWIENSTSGITVNTGYTDSQNVTHNTDSYVHVDSVRTINCQSKGITSLKGIEKFTNLGIINCSSNQIVELSLPGLNSLTSLTCNSNKLETLYLPDSVRLNMLECQDNQLEELDASGLIALNELHCNDNELVSLSLPGKLSYLNCDSNQLTSLDVSNISSLKGLKCSNNHLVKLNANDEMTTYTGGLTLSPQTVTQVLYGSKIGDEYQYRLLGFKGLTSDDMSRITVNGCSSFDASTGIAAFATAQTQITYRYDIYPGTKTEYMDVTVNVAIDGDDTIMGKSVAWLNEATFPDVAFRTWLTNNLTVNTSYTDSQGATRNTDQFIYVDSVTSISIADNGICSLKGIEKFTDLTRLTLSPQTIAQVLYGSKTSDESYQYCLLGFKGLTSDDMSRITVNGCSSFDASTGIAAFATAQTQITYRYDIYPGTKTEYMDVTVNVAIDGDETIMGRSVAWLNEATFPDVAFRTWLTNNLTVNTSYTDSQGATRNTEPFIYVDGVATISCPSQSIASLRGIEKFTELTSLDCSDNALTTLNVSALTKLTSLSCAGNKLAALDCANNPISADAVAGQTLMCPSGYITVSGDVVAVDLKQVIGAVNMSKVTLLAPSDAELSEGVASVPAGTKTLQYEYDTDSKLKLDVTLGLTDIDEKLISFTTAKDSYNVGDEVTYNISFSGGSRVRMFVDGVCGDEYAVTGDSYSLIGAFKTVGNHNVYFQLGDNIAWGAASAVKQFTVGAVYPEVTAVSTDNEFNKVGVDVNTVYCRAKGNLFGKNGESAVARLYDVKGGERTLIGEALLNADKSTDALTCYSLDWDITGVESGDHDVVFVVTDIYGFKGEREAVINVDRSVPAKIINVAAVGDLTVIHVSWSISSEMGTSYKLYRRADDESAAKLIASISERNTLSYADGDVERAKTYYYHVTGVNYFGQQGEPSAASSAALREDTEKPVVTKLLPSNGSYLMKTVPVSLYAQDDYAMASVLMELSTDGGESWTELGRASADTLTVDLDSTALPDGTALIRGTAWDKANNESAKLTYTYFIDNTGPEKVKGLDYESTCVTLTLKWENVADADAAGFYVERKEPGGSYTRAATVRNTLGVNLRGLTPGTSYTYRVAAFDARGNLGAYSDDITASTKADATAPVITSLRPAPGYYSQSVDLSATATDDYNVASITLQLSQTTNEAWTDVHTQTYSDVRASRTLQYTLDLSGYEESVIYVRAIARDSAGNESASDSAAPFVQHIIDRTPPAAPQGVKAVGKSGYIEVAWTQGTENDLGLYGVYRAASENGAYALLKDGLAAINYIDRSAEEGTVYYYKVAVNDTAGNTSAMSQAVSAQVLDDTEPPVIQGVYPANGTSVGNEYRTVTATVSDNRALSVILLEYGVDGGNYQTLLLSENIASPARAVSASLPVSAVPDGAKVNLRVSASDQAGNRCEPIVLTYTVDCSAPAVKAASASFDADKDGVVVSWTGNGENDLAGYKVYRGTAKDGAFALIAQRQAVVGQSAYTCADYTIPIEEGVYYYKIEAIDTCANTSFLLTSAVNVPDRGTPTAVISCEPIWEAGVQYIVDASGSTDNKGIASYRIDLGDGTVSAASKAIHAYPAVGSYTITLTVTDEDGHQDSCTKTVAVKERSALGKAVICVTDADGAAVPGAAVYFDLGEETQTVKTTDQDGRAAFTAQAGKYAVGCLIADNEWLPARKELVVTANETTEVTMVMVRQPIIEGRFDVNRMTFEEIVAAGIDISAPENQHYLEVRVTIAYGSDDAKVKETSFHYNQITGASDARPIIYDTPDGNKRQILIQSIAPKYDSGNNYTVSAANMSLAYLDIPVGVSMLKEFFDVRLHIINNASSEFSMLDNVIDLNVPNGLAIVQSYCSEAKPTVSLAEIKGQTSETITWILRGDKVGDYYISADYSGVLAQYKQTIRTRFVADDPIEVYGLENLRLTLEVPDKLDKGAMYYNVSLSNDGRTDVYCPRIDTGDELIRADLFDATGAAKAEIVHYSADALEELGIATTLSGDPDTLEAGGRLTKHYLCVDQTQYTTNVLELKTEDLEKYAKELRNTYGLEIEIIERELSYFKSFLGIGVDPDRIDQSAYQQLVTDENYAYWNMYASTGAAHSSLTTNGSEMFWNLMKLVGGTGGLKELFGGDDEDLIQAIILDAMEICAKADDYSTQKTVLKWLKKIKSYIPDSRIDEKWRDFIGTREYEINVETLLIQTIDIIIEERIEEFTALVINGDSQVEFVDFFVHEMKTTAYYRETFIQTVEIKETDYSKMIHFLFTAEDFKLVWKHIGYGLDAAQNIVDACEDATLDVSIFLLAQSQLNRCDDFLNALIDYPVSGSDGDKVKKCAEKVKEKIHDMDPLGSFVKSFIEREAWTLAGYGKSLVVKKLTAGLNPKIVAAVKLGLKIVTSVGDNIFNVSERHDIADNIRFVSIMTASVRNALDAAKSAYGNDKTAERARTYMSLISNLINLRDIGESQVALFGITYEVLPGVFDSRDLFYSIREITVAQCDHGQMSSWLEWRDYVEDRLAKLRANLLGKHYGDSGSSLTSPVVTFDYVAGQTAQTFDDKYEYTLGADKVWTPCDGGHIEIDQPAIMVTLYVRRRDISDTKEKLTTAVDIIGAASLNLSGITVASVKGGYSIANLDNQREYALTLSEKPIIYTYEDELELSVPRGSYSYDVITDKEYKYAYIRTVADSKGYASFILDLQIAQSEIPALALRLPQSVLTIEEEALMNTGAEMIVVPSGVQKIGSRAFADSPYLAAVEILSMSVSIPKDMLEGSDKAILYCYSGSQAEKDAKAYNIYYKLIKDAA